MCEDNLAKQSRKVRLEISVFLKKFKSSTNQSPPGLRMEESISSEHSLMTNQANPPPPKSLISQLGHEKLSLN